MTIDVKIHELFGFPGRTVAAHATLALQVGARLALVPAEATVSSIALEVDAHPAAASVPEGTFGVAGSAHGVQVRSHIVALLAVVGLGAACGVFVGRELALALVVRCGASAAGIVVQKAASSSSCCCRVRVVQQEPVSRPGRHSSILQRDGGHSMSGYGGNEYHTQLPCHNRGGERTKCCCHGKIN